MQARSTRHLFELMGHPLPELKESNRLQILHPLAEALRDLAAGGPQTRATLTPLVEDTFAEMFPGCGLADADSMVGRLIVDADPRLNLEAMVCVIAARFIAAEFRK